MANYKLYITTYIGHSVNDTIPSAVGKLNYVRIDTDTGSMFISDGTNWNAVGGSSNLDALTDVDLVTDAPDNNDVLTYSSSGAKWVPAPPPGAGGGEANTLGNVGTGEGTLPGTKTGTTLNVKSLKQGTNITLTNNTNDVTITSAYPPDASDAVKGIVELSLSNGSESGGGRAVQDNDTRLTNARTPTAHNHSGADITSGTVGPTVGGTGKTTFTQHALLKGGAGNTYTEVPVGTEGHVLKVVSGTPAWAAESGGGGGGDATLAGTNTWTGVNTFDLRTQLKSLAATPSDPTSGYTEIYGKVKDANNDGIFAKYKIGGAITEVELGVADDVLSLTELSDVTTTSPADKHFLIHNGTQWINRLIAASDLPSSVPLLNTANVFTAIQKINIDNGQQMTFYRPVNTAGFGAGFYYNFNDSASAEQTYGFQYVSIESNTAGAVRGDFNLQLAVAGSLGIRFRAFTSGNGGIIFGNNQRALLSETGLTAQRTITLPDSDQTLLGRTDTATITNKTIQGLKTNVNAKTATYTAALTDDYIPCAPAANMTINLPAASTAAGKRLKIQKTDNSAFTVTIDANSTETINGAGTYVLNAQYQVVELECDGAAWYTTGYSISREGTAQGNGNATTYNIPHGLGVVPSYYHAICTAPSGVSAYTQSADATNITVVFSSSTPAGTNNVKFSWRAVI